MGLDQYGGWLEPQKNKEQEDNVVELFQEASYTWASECQEGGLLPECFALEPAR